MTIITSGYPNPLHMNRFLAAGFSIWSSWFQHLERAHQSLIDTHHSTSVVIFTSIVGSRKYGNQLPVSEKFLSILYDLMTTTGKIQIVYCQKLAHLIRTEYV